MKSMGQLLLAMISVLTIIYVVPFLVYSLFTLFTDLKTPDDATPLLFLVGVLVSKMGVAVSFVLIFYFARPAFNEKWLLYAFTWWLFFVIDETGRSIGSDYTMVEATAGIISETTYFPLSAYVVNWLLGQRTRYT